MDFINTEDRKKREIWSEICASIPALPDDAYDLEWGRRREKFYEEVGGLELPQKDKLRLKSLKDKYCGNRIFILGNGPSINNTPLEFLKNEFTFVVNRSYLLYDRIDWKPTFYTALDWRVVPDVAREINALTGSTFFFEERFRGILREGEDVYYYTHSAADPRYPEEKQFALDVSRGVRGAGSVVGTAVQLAYHMGFDPIYLIGCDLGYKVLKSVDQQGEDKFGNGVKLHLTSTRDDDPNHFDPRYFGKGRRWHDPNVKRMIQGHEQCRKAIEENGRRIFNATVGGELEVYQRRDFRSLFECEPIEYERERHAALDETNAISVLFDQIESPDERTMIDVGAHRGTSSMHFADKNWQIFCFEPDQNNRALLTRRFAKAKNVIIDPRAVSDKASKGMSFFKSEESSGISALHAFRDTHEEADQVEVTTVAEIVKQHGIKHVDFLKIDVEGFDFNVLKGVPWDQITPDVIECEYEDAKTIPMGHDWRDIAEFLRKKGYSVYLSEWHPIVRYGIPHDWRQVVPYPEMDVPSESWGNILAFREDPGFAKVQAAFEKLVQFRKPKPEAKPPVTPSISKADTLPLKEVEMARMKLADFHNICRGRRCFIVGNGPSLNHHDLSLLENEFVFGANGIFYKSDETGFVPTFYVVEDTKVMEENIERIKAYDVPHKFLPSLYKSLHPDSKNVHFFEMDRGFYDPASSCHGVPRFSTDASKSLYCGQSVTYINLQLAYFMGFSEVFLIGMDFDYTIPPEHVRDGDLILSTTDDPNHFHKDYFGKGKTWKDPKLDLVAMNYLKAKQTFEAAGRMIYNATVGGKLEIFPRVDYEALLRDPETGKKRLEPIAPVHVSSGEMDTSAVKLATISGEATPVPEATVTSSRSIEKASPQPKEKKRSRAEIRAARRAKFRRDPHLFFRDSNFFLLRPLRHFFKPTGVKKWEAEMTAETRRREDGFFSFLPISRKAHSRSLEKLKLERTQSETSYRAEIARTKRDAQQRETVLRNDLTKLRENLESLEARFLDEQQSAKTGLQDQLASLEARLTVVSSDLDEVTRDRVETLESKIGQELSGIQEQLAAGEVKSAKDQTRLLSDIKKIREIGSTREARRRGDNKKVERSIAALDRRLVATSEKLAESEASARIELAQLNKLVGTLEAKKDAYQQTLQAEISVLDERISAEAKAIADNKATVQAEIAALDKRLATELDKLAESKAVLQSQIESQKTSTTEVAQEIEATKAQLNEVEAASQELRAAIEESIEALKVADARQSKSEKLLRQRVMSSERQIGSLRYSDTPQTLVFFGHHKCGSRLFRQEIFQIVAQATGAKIHQYRVISPPFHYSRADELDLCNIDFDAIGKSKHDVVLFANGSQRSLERLDRETTDWRGIRIIRDPRQVLVSNYFHHKGDHEVESLGWIWDQLKHDQPILRELPEEEGLLHELDHISKEIIETQILAPFDDERILTIKLEDFAEDQDAWLLRISEFLKVADIAGADLSRTYANPDSSPWQNHFTTRIRDVFKERYGQALIDLGYSDDLDW